MADVRWKAEDRMQEAWGCVPGWGQEKTMGQPGRAESVCLKGQWKLSPGRLRRLLKSKS